METVLKDLIAQWLAGNESIPVVDQASTTLVRERVRELGKAIAMPADALDPLLIAATELAQNQLNHVGQGAFTVRQIERDGVLGLELIAADRGGGIAKPSQALSGRVANPTGLGAGLSAVTRLTDETDFDIRLGEGSCVWARKFQHAVRRRRQVGVFGRPHPHERVSGDHANVLRTAEGLVIRLADGLGHGPEARAAACVAAQQPLASTTESLESVLLGRHDALRGTRGAVMAIAQLSESPLALTAANVGNVQLAIWGPGVAKRLGGTAFTLGAPGPLPRIRIEQVELRPWDALVLFTDGISSRADLSSLPDLLLDHPIVIAETLLSRFGVPHDDALVVVAR